MIHLESRWLSVILGGEVGRSRALMVMARVLLIAARLRALLLLWICAVVVSLSVVLGLVDSIAVGLLL